MALDNMQLYIESYLWTMYKLYTDTDTRVR